MKWVQVQQKSFPDACSIAFHLFTVWKKNEKQNKTINKELLCFSDQSFSLFFLFSIDFFFSIFSIFSTVFFLVAFFLFSMVGFFAIAFAFWV